MAKEIGKAEGPFNKPMPSPTEEERATPEFEAIWETIKTWDINVPEYYDGYCGANGSHVALIVKALNGDDEEVKDARQ